jgi:hypothetical protein
MDESDRTSGEGPSLFLQGIQYVRQHERLLELIRAKRDAGLISDEHARMLESLKERLYKEQGIWREPGAQTALHSVSETQAYVAVARQACHLVETKLLDLYPELKDDVRSALATESPGR